MGRLKGFDEIYHMSRGGRLYHFFSQELKFFLKKVNTFAMKISALSIITKYCYILFRMFSWNYEDYGQTVEDPAYIHEHCLMY